MAGNTLRDYVAAEVGRYTQTQVGAADHEEIGEGLTQVEVRVQLTLCGYAEKYTVL